MKSRQKSKSKKQYKSGVNKRNQSSRSCICLSRHSTALVDKKVAVLQRHRSSLSSWKVMPKDSREVYRERLKRSDKEDSQRGSSKPKKRITRRKPKKRTKQDKRYRRKSESSFFTTTTASSMEYDDESF